MRAARIPRELRPLYPRQDKPVTRTDGQAHVTGTALALWSLLSAVTGLGGGWLLQHGCPVLGIGLMASVGLCVRCVTDEAATAGDQAVAEAETAARAAAGTTLGAHVARLQEIAQPVPLGNLAAMLGRMTDSNEPADVQAYERLLAREVIFLRCPQARDAYQAWAQSGDRATDPHGTAAIQAAVQGAAGKEVTEG